MEQILLKDYFKENDLIVFDDKHILVYGDSANNKNILEQVLNYKGITKTYFESNSILYTDPPYNAAFNGRSGDHEVIKNDSMTQEEFEQFTQKWYNNIVKQYKFNSIYIWCNNYLKGVIEKIDSERWLMPGLKPIVWVKNNFGMGRNYRPKYELLMFKGEIDSSILNECDVWNIRKDDGSNYIHPTQKPLECFSRGIKNHSLIKYVVDIFAGSGSCLIATVNDNTNKEWIGVEIDELYISKIIKRYYDYTMSKNIKIIRANGSIVNFESLKAALKLNNATTSKGVVLNQNTLFSLLD
jgi:site-specific DNA-methyltransferase (adenine-specific)